jgi:hypothetical protein
MFYLSDESLQELDSRIKKHHELYDRKIVADYSEEAIYKSLLKDKTIKIEWDSGSHKDYDMIVTTGFAFPRLIVSIKSGTMTAYEGIKISGHRLTRFVDSHTYTPDKLTELNEYLNSSKPDVIISLVYMETDIEHTYRLIYIPSSVFSYPQTASGWLQKRSQRGKTPGSVCGFTYTAPNKVFSEIQISTSSQIWWTIPLSLCIIKKIIKARRTNE